MVYAVKIKYTWTQHTQKTENNAIRKRPAISNKVTRLKPVSVADVCVGGQLLAHTNCAFSSLAKRDNTSTH